MTTRRRRVGKSLLSAATLTGGSMIITGCYQTTGNLMAPPISDDLMICFEVQPESAQPMIAVDQSIAEAQNLGTVFLDGTCGAIESGERTILAVADGFKDHTETILFEEDGTYEFEMLPLDDDTGVGSEE